jgi:hypothetical protein
MQLPGPLIFQAPSANTTYVHTPKVIALTLYMVRGRDKFAEGGIKKMPAFYL